MVLLRHMLGDALRRLRLRQGRTLREVSAAARVSLGYLSEVERGQKEASSELLASICGALGAPLSQVLREVSDGFALAELQNEPVYAPLEPALAGSRRPEPGKGQEQAAASTATRRIPAPVRVPQPARQHLVTPSGQRKLMVRSAQHLVPPAEPLLEPVSLPGDEPGFDTLTREITNMVPV